MMKASKLWLEEIKKTFLSDKKIINYINGFSYRIENIEEKAINIFKEMYNEIKL